MKRKNFLVMAVALIASLTLLLTACGGNAPEVDDNGSDNASAKEYVFEAEYTYLEDVAGMGFSGGPSGIGMVAIDADNEWKASNGFYVDYLYKSGTALTFKITSDKAVDNASITLRLSALSADGKLTLSKDIYSVEVNGSKLDYKDINFFNLPADVNDVCEFKDYKISTSLNLKEGENIIKLITSNDISMGGTTTGTAPRVDCIKISTEAKLTWTPVESNLDEFA